VFGQFAQCHLKMMLTDVSAVIGREDSPLISDEELTLHDD